MVFIDSEIKQIISEIQDEEQQKTLINYIENLLDEITTLRDVEAENEQEIHNLEQDLEDRPSAKFLDLVKEVVDGQWKYLVPTYKTKEEILDRLEFLIKYEA